MQLILTLIILVSICTLSWASARTDYQKALWENRKKVDRTRLDGEAWKRYVQEVCLNEGDCSYIRDMQANMCADAEDVIRARAMGATTNKEFLRDIVDLVSKKYAKRMVANGLTTAVFDEEFVRPFRAKLVEIVRDVRPLEDGEITSEEIIELSRHFNPYVRQFIKTYHEQYGVQRLKTQPEIYDERFLK